MSARTGRLCVVTLVGVGLAGFAALAQERTQENTLWSHKGRVVRTEAATKQSTRSDQATPRSPEGRLRAFSRFSANDDTLRAVLRRVPREFSGSSGVVLAIPLPDGGYEQVRVEESSIYSAELQAKYDYVRTYIARGLDDQSLTGRLDYTPAGFHAMLISERGSVFVDPAADGSGEYVSYWKNDAIGEPFRCDTHDVDMQGAPSLRGLVDSSVAGGIGILALNPSGTQLRTYRLAVSATGEYTQFFDGNPATAGTPNTVAQITTTMNRVNGIYERELQIRLNLTATRIFDDPTTDPFTSGDFRTENQTVMNANPGAANYDVGHVVHRITSGSSGVASGSVVCVDASKARGFTSSANPSGDPYDVDYVAHEIGHQFSGNHTWTSNNGSCSAAAQFQAAAAYEPGSGSTIMAYAGICSPDNVQNNSDAYFHTRSYDEIVAFRTSGNGSTCGTVTNTGNNPPAINAGPDCTIPRNTPFTLTATGSDPDGHAVTYNWEQFDAGPWGQLPAGTNTTGPLFRSRPATSSPSRTFPRMADILSGVATPWETLANVDRTLNFRATARDNQAGGGGVDYDSMVVTVSGAPFAFTFPTTSSNLECGGSANVQWSVGGGSIAANVAIESSANDGSSFATLVASTANDGSESVTVPKTLTTQGRLKLAPIDACFFNVSQRFSIVDTLAPTITAPKAVVAECTSPSGTPVSLGTPTASDLCDSTLSIGNNAPALFPLGTTSVIWTATDDSSHQSSDTQSVTIQDTTPAVISCNAPPAIVPSDAPLSFTATAVDVCDAAPVATVTGFRCYTINGSGKIVDKGESCVVTFSAGSITIVNPGGIDNTIEWTVNATDGSGNTSTATCSVRVVKKT
jgi:hypothetical protein